MGQAAADSVLKSRKDRTALKRSLASTRTGKNTYLIRKSGIKISSGYSEENLYS
ncbi:MAG: hypothetical protein WC254_02235 [Candidatus Woesearchaeota archaeon]|jgi:hypothetical protein